MRAPIPLVGLLLLAAAPLGAQESRHHSVHTENGRSLEVEVVGEVEISDDDRRVEGLSPGGRMTIEERAPGRATRRVEFRAAAGGGVERLYREGGRSAAPDAEAEAWIERVLLEAIRRSGIAAEERVARFLARGGVGAVLAEIAQIEGDGAMDRYFRALLAAASPTPDETAALLRLAGERIGSDGTLARLLREVEERSDVDREPVRSAFFAAAGTIGSDGERARTLDAPLRRGRLSEATLVALLRSAGGIGSDGERSRLLARVAAEQSISPEAVRGAFFRAAGGIGTDGDRARVLRRVLGGHASDAAVVREAVRSARGIGSDGDKAGVLLLVPPEALRDDAAAREFVEVLRTIGSDGDRARVALHLLEARGS